MICAPPSTVLINDACPGQSTNVNLTVSYPLSDRNDILVANEETIDDDDDEGDEEGESEVEGVSGEGESSDGVGGSDEVDSEGMGAGAGTGAQTGISKAEKPRSRVIPRSWLCLLLSKAAVDARVESTFASVVLPLSTCPKIPMLKFKHLSFRSPLIWNFFFFCFFF
jgi:hypothetical protein